jgi:Transposase IS116/IS110/IS902 family
MVAAVRDGRRGNDPFPRCLTIGHAISSGPRRDPRRPGRRPRGPPQRSLNRYKQLDEIIARLAGFDGLVARLAFEIAHSVRGLTMRNNDLERELTASVKKLAPTLLTRPEIAGLTAAKILGETADITRFKSKDAYARHTGTALLPVWSGNRIRHRLARTGTGNSNPPYIASLSPKVAAIPTPAPSANAASPNATPAAKHSEHSNAASPTSSTATSSTTRPRPSEHHSRLPLT